MTRGGYPDYGAGDAGWGGGYPGYGEKSKGHGWRRGKGEGGAEEGASGTGVIALTTIIGTGETSN
jgi:hypothetical protein